jgi:hypothetical protein
VNVESVHGASVHQSAVRSRRISGVARIDETRTERLRALYGERDCYRPPLRFALHSQVQSVEKVRYIYDLLMTTKHNGFPVVSGNGPKRKTA